MLVSSSVQRMRHLGALLCGGVVGILGGLLGLGGAEFRLPLFVSVFRYRISQAILLNLLVSLATVAGALIFRTKQVPLASVMAHGAILVNLLAGSLLGSAAGVHLSTRIAEQWLHRTVALLLIALSLVLMGHHWLLGSEGLGLPAVGRMGVGFVAGIGIGVVSSLLGVAGGELIIPTLVLVFGLDIKLAGSLSLAISLPTIMMGLWRHHRRQSLRAQVSEGAFIGWMSVGSMVGAWMGSGLLRWVSSAFLHIFLGLLLLLAAAKMLRHPSA